MKEKDEIGFVINNPICSETYMHFIRAIGCYFNSMEKLFEKLVAEIPPVAELLHVGHLSMEFEAPKSPLQPTGKQFRQTVYETAHDPAFMEKLCYATPEKGQCIIHYCPEAGYTWAPAEMDALRFLTENIFSCFSRTRMYRLLSRVSSRDYMTDALNTKGMIEYGNELLSQGRLRNFVGMFLNLRNFKYINQTAGQRYGDRIIIRYYQLLCTQLRGDERISRPGGDNFFALIEKPHAQDFLAYLKEVPLEVTIGHEPRSFCITANVGVYDIQPRDDMSNVLNYATVALNEVKHSGKGIDQLWYDASMLDQIMHDKRISQLLPSALEKHEFLVYYQPKVTLSSQTLCGCEALVRWYNDGRIIPPIDFIQVLEREGTICQLDFYVFEQVCKDLRHWLDIGIEPVCVSVNFSHQHLHNEVLSEKILSIMQKYRIDSRYIEIELTELSGVKNHDAMLAFLQRMHEYGISTSIDDFGTGFSSLNMLREFQMDIIKLDKSFVDRICDDGDDYRNDAIVIENIVRMVQDLKLQIISEGVETREQMAFLKGIKCDMAQGYLFDMPLPHDEFEQRLLGSRQYILPDDI